MVVLFSGVLRMWFELKCCCRLVVVWNMLLLMFMFLFSISIDGLCFSFQVSVWVMVLMRVIGVVVMLLFLCVIVVLLVVLVCVLGVLFLILFMVFFQGDCLGMLGQQVWWWIGIQEVEYCFDWLYWGVEVQVYFFVYVCVVFGDLSGFFLFVLYIGVDQVFVQVQYWFVLLGIFYFGIVVVVVCVIGGGVVGQVVGYQFQYGVIVVGQCMFVCLFYCCQYCDQVVVVYLQVVQVVCQVFLCQCFGIGLG